MSINSTIQNANLTEVQQAAVEHFEGPLLVLAGPGSGKTRVITHRIVRLLQRGVQPDQILALTFTNKAAREMAARIERLLGGLRVRVSTFHRFCSRLLRRWPENVGLRENFTILDQSDQVTLVRNIMKEERLDGVFHEPGRVLSRISRARNDMITAELFRQQFEQRVGNPLDAIVYQVFPLYEARVRQQNSVDFDDLLLHVVNLLEDDEHIREELDQHFRYILVDEYQDTNFAQYRIVQAMSQLYPNLCATGDPDQSIYGWRGARPGNITTFERDFPDVQIVSLDQNFRSTQRIVKCADQLISHNRRPHRGKLTTDNPEGTAVRLLLFENADAEADGVAAEIAARVKSGERNYSDFAIFYRVNALSRLFETALSRHHVPFQVAAGYSFYERAEVRDLVAYLRLIENFSDDSAMERIINRPARGIGNTTLLKLRNHAKKHGVSVFEAACEASTVSGLNGRSIKAVAGFVDLIQKLHEMSADGRVAPLIERLISDIDYLSLWREESDEVDIDRAANVFELVSAARQYDAAGEMEEEDNTDATARAVLPGSAHDIPSLQGFLELATLSNEADSVDANRGAVTLMTLHASKGLEFPAVYIIGIESGLIPHERAVRDGDPASFEEERRLFFVGITRAMQELTLTQTSERTFRGMRRTTISSPFVPELYGAISHESSVATPPPVAEALLDQRLEQARRRFAAAQIGGDRKLLMTAAELAAKQEQLLIPDVAATNDLDTATMFREGMLVRHPRYGRGTITEVSGGSHRATVTVDFENDGESHTFVASRCPLQPIGPS
ncbi:MAG TPA: UvrD-helicase domain-containing protein [Planctomycetaceae bacterium]|nr:UvrD-helicase domain-containing protein [Planctomycetaceae bacterium]